MPQDKPFHIIDRTTGSIVATYFSSRHRITRGTPTTDTLLLTEEQFREALFEVTPNARLKSGRNEAARLVLCEGMSPALAAFEADTTPSNVSALVRLVEQAAKRRIATEQATKEFE